MPTVKTQNCVHCYILHFNGYCLAAFFTVCSNNPENSDTLTFTTLWANSADNKSVMYFIIFQKIGFYNSYKLGDNLHEISKPILTQFDARQTGDQEVAGWTPAGVSIDHEIFSTVILSLLLIQEGQL